MGLFSAFDVEGRRHGKKKKKKKSPGWHGMRACLRPFRTRAVPHATVSATWSEAADALEWTRPHFLSISWLIFSIDTSSSSVAWISFMIPVNFFLMASLELAAIIFSLTPSVSGHQFTKVNFDCGLPSSDSYSTSTRQ